MIRNTRVIDYEIQMQSNFYLSAHSKLACELLEYFSIYPLHNM